MFTKVPGSIYTLVRVKHRGRMFTTSIGLQTVPVAEGSRAVATVTDPSVQRLVRFSYAPVYVRVRVSRATKDHQCRLAPHLPALLAAWPAALQNIKIRLFCVSKRFAVLVWQCLCLAAPARLRSGGGCAPISHASAPPLPIILVSLISAS
jgi:hypothetical protein